MNLLPKEYNYDYSLHAGGLKNTGVICYFNSLLQSLFSCPAFIETILNLGYENGMDKDLGHNRGSLANNELLRLLFLIFRNLKKSENTGNWDHRFSIAIWKTFMKEIKRQEKQVLFGRGQEDSHEALLLFLDCLQSRTIDELFQHRYRVYIKCPSCNNRYEAEKLNGSIRMISYIDEESSKKYPLMEFLSQHTDMTDENHKCDNCNFRGEKEKEHVLSMMPEIFIVLFKKYETKWVSNRPEKLSFQTNQRLNHKHMKYNLVSQIEHSGTKNGGHYWARSLRRDGVYVLNDSNAVKQPSWSSGEPNVYMAWYHYSGLE